MEKLTVSLILVALASSAVGAAFDPSTVMPTDQETGRFLYQEVVAVEGAPSSELYSRAKTWLAVAYRSSTDVIKLDDPQAGRLIAKGVFETSWMTGTTGINHVWTIEVKDGRFRYALTDFVFDNGYWSAPLEDSKKFIGAKKGLYVRVHDNAESMIASLKAAMQTPTPAGSNW